MAPQGWGREIRYEREERRMEMKETGAPVSPGEKVHRPLKCSHRHPENAAKMPQKRAVGKRSKIQRRCGSKQCRFQAGEAKKKPSKESKDQSAGNEGWTQNGGRQDRPGGSRWETLAEDSLRTLGFCLLVCFLLGVLLTLSCVSASPVCPQTARARP